MTDAEKRIPLVFFRTEAGAGPIGMPLCLALGGGLFELRSSLTTRRIARVIVCVFENELYALHGFIKKIQKTPAVDLDLARRRKRQLERAR